MYLPSANIFLNTKVKQEISEVWGEASREPRAIWLKSLGKVEHGSQEKRMEVITIERVNLDSARRGE